MAWTATRRDINLTTRFNGETQTQKLSYVKPTNITATEIKTAVTGLVSALSMASYVNGEIVDTYDLNEAADSEEE